MLKSLAQAILLIALMVLVGACGPAATAVPPSAAVVSPAPTAAPPSGTSGLPSASAVPSTTAAIAPALTPTPTAAVPAPTSKAGAPGFLLEGVGFRTPESVLYDPGPDVYLVANIHGDPSARDGNGFISRISPEGEVIALRWIDGQAFDYPVPVQDAFCAQACAQLRQLHSDAGSPSPTGLDVERSAPGIVPVEEGKE